MPKPNFIFFDTETSGGRGLADILTIDALYYDYNFNLIGEFSCKARLRKSRVYEVDSFLDGINVERLSKLITSQSSNAQFIVVSHRRPMISASERTIGVAQARGANTQVVGLPNAA